MKRYRLLVVLVTLVIYSANHAVPIWAEGYTPNVISIRKQQSPPRPTAEPGVPRTPLETEQQRLTKEGIRLQQTAESLLSLRKRMDDIQDEIKSDVETISKRTANLKVQSAKVRNMRYTDCPNGESFGSCNHSSAKAAFILRLSRAQQLIRQESLDIQRASNFTNDRLEKLRKSRKTYSQLATTLKAEGDKYKSDYAQLLELQKQQQLVSGSTRDKKVTTGDHGK